MTEPRGAGGGIASRRALLGGALAAALGLLDAGCGGAEVPPPRPAPPPLPPLATGDLAGLLPLAGLRWLILARPREIATIAWLIPEIAQIVPEANLDRFAAATGVDLRQLPEAAIAGHGDATVWLARHTGDPTTIERLFRARLTGRARRAVDRPDLLRLSGDIGRTPRALALLGRDVVAFQDGGSPTRGPARVAALYALGKLTRSPTALSEEPLRSLAARFGPAPLTAFALGPFEGELARGARGLLAGATAIGAAARPSAREKILAAIAVTGDFSTSGPAASEELLAAWDELARSALGRLLGLDEPVMPALPTHAADAVAIAVELEPGKLARGIRAATGAEIEEIMR